MAGLSSAVIGSTSVTSPAAFVSNPWGWFIQELTATTLKAPPIPAITIGTPLQKWAQPLSRFQP